MGFPTPFNLWARAEARDFITDTLTTVRARNRELIDNAAVVARLNGESEYARDLWGLFSLELWQQTFHDRAAEFKAMAEPAAALRPVAAR
jgi:asparagine synthase (glutamine-hydrolysing)